MLKDILEQSLHSKEETSNSTVNDTMYHAINDNKVVIQAYKDNELQYTKENK